MHSQQFLGPFSQIFLLPMMHPNLVSLHEICYISNHKASLKLFNMFNARKLKRCQHLFMFIQMNLK